jgi:hypothetical protein
MATFQPIVRATVVDIQTDRPQASDRFLVDTYDIFRQIGQTPVSLKEYRHGFPRERTSRVIPEIQAAWNLVQSYGECLETEITQATITENINNLQNYELDGYDSLITSSLTQSSISQVITDDIDFISVNGMIV